MHTVAPGFDEETKILGKRITHCNTWNMAKTTTTTTKRKQTQKKKTNKKMKNVENEKYTK